MCRVPYACERKCEVGHTLESPQKRSLSLYAYFCAGDVPFASTTCDQGPNPQYIHSKHMAWKGSTVLAIAPAFDRRLSERPWKSAAPPESSARITTWLS